MEEIVNKMASMATKAIDEAIKNMLERNGFNVGNTNNHADLLLLQDDLKNNNCTVQLRNNQYELWKEGTLIDKVEVKFDFALDSDIAKYGATIRIT